MYSAHSNGHFISAVSTSCCRYSVFCRNSLNHSPPLTSPLVQTADMDNVVRVVTTADKSTMTVAKPIPACPTTQESRKYSITPHMLSRQPNSTPLIQPNLGAFSTLLFLTSKGSEPSSIFLSSGGAGCSTNSAYRKKNHSCCYMTKFYLRFVQCLKVNIKSHHCLMRLPAP